MILYMQEIIMKNLIKNNKKIYREIHLKYGNVTKKRVSTSINISDLDNKNLSEKIGLDVCCGALGLGAINLINLGIKNIHLFDLNRKNVISSKKNIMKTFKDKNINIELHIGNLENFKFKKNYYDIILFQGALHHMEKDIQALKNVYRGAKKTCSLLLTFQGKGRLVTNTTFDVFNKSYFEDKKARFFFDKLFANKSNFKKSINFLKKNTNKDGSKLLELILKLADSDFFQTLEDRIKSKRYYQYSYEEIENKLLKVGFKKIKLIKKLSKHKYSNLRQIFNSVYMNKNYSFKSSSLWKRLKSY